MDNYMHSIKANNYFYVALGSYTNLSIDTFPYLNGFMLHLDQ